MANVTFDKKQLPQVAALGTLSACMFGYFGFKMISPPATQAAPPAPAAGASAGTAGGASSPSAAASSATDPASGGASGTDGDSVDPSALIGAPAPSTAMRDPFAATAAPASIKTVSSGDSAPKALPSLAALSAAQGGPKAEGASSLPSLTGAPAAAPAPAPVAPQVVSPATQWSVSGVICSDINPSLSLAIFRAGNVRRYVRVGEWLDNTTQLTSLNRTGVVLVRSGMHFRLPLGASPELSGAAQQQQPSVSAPMPTPIPSPAAQQPSLPQEHAELPAPPAQAYPVVTIADASQPVPIEKVGDSVQISTLGVTKAAAAPSSDAAAAAAAAPQPTDADSPSSGAMDIPTFNSDLPAQTDDAGQSQDASWVAQQQDNGAPITSILLAPDQSGDPLHLLNSEATVPVPGFPAFAAGQMQQPSGGFGMKLISTPSSVLQALGIDSSLFTPQLQTRMSAVPEACDAAAPPAIGNPVPGAGATTDAPAVTASASVFQQYDAATGADMIQIACIDQPDASSSSPAAQGASTPSTANQGDFNPLSALSVAYQQDFHWLSKEFTS